MPTPRTKKTGAGRRKPRFTRARPAASKPAAPPRGAVAKRRTPPQAAPAGPRRTPRRLKLPTWDDLAGGNGPAAAAGRRPAFDSVSTLRFALFLLVLALAVTLYVGHVHASQEVLTEVQRLRRENLDLHLKYNRLKGEYDQMTSPARIYERARGLGLVEDVTYGGTITIER